MKPLKAIWAVASAIGLAFGALSVFHLVIANFELDLARSVRPIIDFYIWAIDAFFFWADPPLRALLQYLSNWVDIPDLGPHWKHVFVPLGLYIAHDAKVTFGMPGIERKVSAVAISLYGGLAVLAASVAAGTVPVDSRDLLFVIYPIGGVLLFQLMQCLWDTGFHRYGNTAWQTFRYYMVWTVLTTAIAGGLVVGIGLVAQNWSLPGINVALLVLFVILLAARHLAVGWRIATKERLSGPAWTVRFENLASTRLGYGLLIVIAGSFLFLILNAGLVLAGQ